MKIELQTLTDVNTDRLAKLQALASLRQFLGFDAVPTDDDVAGSLVYEPVPLRLEDVQARALANVPTSWQPSVLSRLPRARSDSQSKR